MSSSNPNNVSNGSLNISELHAKFIRAMIKYVLPSVVPKYTLQDKLYPVIVGGANIDRCARMSIIAKRLVSFMRLNDIDFKFLIMNGSTVQPNIIKSKMNAKMNTKTNSFYNDDVLDIDWVDQHRREFIKDIISPRNDKLLQALNEVGLMYHHPLGKKAPKLVGGKCAFKPGIGVAFDTVTKYADKLKPGEHVDPKFQKVRNARLVMVDAVYIDMESGLELNRTRIIDTTIMTIDEIQGFYAEYFAFLQKSKDYNMKNTSKHYTLTGNNLSIPLYMHKKVLYGTCHWNYIDTVRMLDIYAIQVKNPMENQTVSNTLFNLEHFVKYLAKFVIMYIYINNLKDKDKNLQQLTQILKNTCNLQKELLSQEVSNAIAADTKLDDRYIRMTWFFKHKLDEHTNLKQLLSAIQSVSPNKENIKVATLSKASIGKRVYDALFQKHVIRIHK